MGCSPSSLSKVRPNLVSEPTHLNQKELTKVQPEGEVVCKHQTPKKISSSVAPLSSVDDCGLVYHERLSNSDNLVSMCKKGKLSEVSELLKSDGVDVNVTGMWGNTPLIVACQYSHKSIALLLLEQPLVDVNHINENGSGALLFASLEGMVDVVAKLLELGANVNPPPAVIYNPLTDRSNFMSPLSASVVNGYEAIVSLLLDGGGQVNGLLQQRGEGPHTKNSPSLVQDVSLLMLACKHQREAIIALLMARGADVSCRDSAGCTVVHYTCRSGTSADRTLAALMATGNASLTTDLLCAVDNTHTTPLHMACECKCVAAVEMLLSLEGFATSDGAIQRTAFVNTINHAGLSALHIAIKKRSVDIVKLLLQYQADPHVQPLLAGEKPPPTPFDMAKKLRADSDVYKLVCALPLSVPNMEELSRPCTPSKRQDQSFTPCADLSPTGDDPECADGGTLDWSSTSHTEALGNVQTPKKTYNSGLEPTIDNRMTNAPRKEARSATRDVRPPSPVALIEF